MRDTGALHTDLSRRERQRYIELFGKAESLSHQMAQQLRNHQTGDDESAMLVTFVQWMMTQLQLKEFGEMVADMVHDPLDDRTPLVVDEHKESEG